MKKAMTYFSTIVILIAGIYCAASLASMPPTYDGRGTDLVALHEDPSSYEITDPDGAAEIVVKTNLEKTRSENAVGSVVFNYRGYDTMGESFVLLTAVAGALVILRRGKTGKEA